MPQIPIDDPDLIVLPDNALQDIAQYLTDNRACQSTSSFRLQGRLLVCPSGEHTCEKRTGHDMPHKCPTCRMWWTSQS